MLKTISFFKPILLINMFLLPLQKSYAYLDNISIWPNKKTGQVLYVGSDTHNLGTVEKNQQQKQFFMENIIDEFARREIDLTLLVESSTYYNVPQPLTKEGAHSAFSWRHSRTKPPATQTSWVPDIFEDLLFKGRSYPNIFMSSVDPRLLTGYWSIGDISFKTLFSIGKEIPELEEFLVKEPLDPLSQAINRLDAKLEQDFETILHSIGKSLADKDILCSEPNRALIKKGIIIENDIKTIGHLLSGDTPLLASALDKIALWRIAKSKTTHTFLLAGGWHSKGLEAGLRDIGFERKLSEGISAQDDFKTDPVIRLGRLAGYPHLALSLRRKEDVEVGLMVIKNRFIAPSLDLRRPEQETLD